jgi:hypothetical protein
MTIPTIPALAHASGELARAYRELRGAYPDVPAVALVSWARTRLEILAYVGGDHDDRGDYAMTVDLPGRARVFVTAEPDLDDCGLGDACDDHGHVSLIARCPERAGRTVLASLGAVCDGPGDTYEYLASCALDLAREAHETADDWERDGLV